MLNVTIIYEREHCIFDFNFDYKISDIENILAIFGEENTIIEEKFSIAKGILEQLYNLELEN